jgi:hypothetical protein
VFEVWGLGFEGSGLGFRVVVRWAGERKGKEGEESEGERREKLTVKSRHEGDKGMETIRAYGLWFGAWSSVPKGK